LQINKLSNTQFIKSVYQLKELPIPEYPEIAFAGRSNVGKSSLINCLINRKKLVKVSSKPGKTRCLNFFQAADYFYLVDLPGYGYAQVPKKMRREWEGLITSYLETRKTLCGVVIIIDIRHETKAQDRELVNWFSNKDLPFLPVYTKVDKISKGKWQKHAKILDSGLGVTPEQRILFSAKSKQGREELFSRICNLVSRTTKFTTK
jgi:GTP-binding protein